MPDLRVLHMAGLHLGAEMVKHMEKIGFDEGSESRLDKPAPRKRVPGPSENPETNLIMADVAMRAGTIILRSAVEKGFLKGRYGPETAAQIVDNRSLKKTLASFALAKLATRSLPGAVLIGGSMMAKTLFDRGRKRRSRRKGDHALKDQAAGE